MPNSFSNPASRVAIAERIAERQRRTECGGNLDQLDERYSPDEPISKADARTQALKWFWQH